MNGPKEFPGFEVTAASFLTSQPNVGKANGSSLGNARYVVHTQTTNNYWWSVPVFLVLGFFSAASAELFLVKDGKPEAVLVLPEKPSVIEDFTRQMLVSHFLQMTGAKVPWVFESELGILKIDNGRADCSAQTFKNLNLVFAGNCFATTQLGISTNQLPEDSLVIRTGSNWLVIDGKGKGVQHAAVRILENSGVRYLWPGELGKVVPRSKDISIDLNVSETPKLKQRRIRSHGLTPRMSTGLRRLAYSPAEFTAARAESEKTEAITPTWFEWHGLGGSLDVVFGHAFGDSWQKYGKVHPEWFALQPDGTRDQKASPDRSRFCHSNKELAAQLAKDFLDALAINPNTRSFPIGLNDGGQTTFCMCEACKALDAPDGAEVNIYKIGKYVSLSDRVVAFTNQVVQPVFEKHPDVLFGYYAYSCYTSPPLRTRLHPNVVPSYVGIHYLDEAYREESLKEWDAWSKMVKGGLIFRPNLLLAGRRAIVPLNYVHKMTKDFQHLSNTGLIGTDFDSCQHNWAMLGLNYYVLSRLHWNPELNVNELVDDYCRSGFGLAAEDVSAYFSLIEQMTDQMALKKVGITDAYSSDRCKKLNSILDGASERAAERTDVLNRIEFLKIGLRFARLQSQVHGLRNKKVNGEVVDSDSFKKLLDERFHLMRTIFSRHHMAINVANLCWADWGYWGVVSWQRPRVEEGLAPEAGEEKIEFEF